MSNPPARTVARTVMRGKIDMERATGTLEQTGRRAQTLPPALSRRERETETLTSCR
jgi:hypothetical protein